MKFSHIFSDHRGTIHAITDGLYQYPEIAIMQTKAGLARGGCIHHDSIEYLTVLEGTIVYVYGGNPNNSNARKIDIDTVGKCSVRMNAGDSIAIQPNTPHYFISMTDSTIAEWGAKLSEKQEKHEAFRKIVMEYNQGK